jgi:hypothetical protein
MARRRSGVPSGLQGLGGRPQLNSGVSRPRRIDQIAATTAASTATVTAVATR